MAEGRAAYRLLLRARAAAFKGDAPTLQASGAELRARFEEHRALAGAARDRALAEAREAAEFLASHVVQAELNERGNFAMQVEPRHAHTLAEEAAPEPGAVSGVPGAPRPGAKQ